MPASVRRFARPSPTPLRNWMGVSGVTGGTSGIVPEVVKSTLCSGAAGSQPAETYRRAKSPPLHSIKNRLHRDQPDLQQIAVVDRDGDAGGDALVVDVCPVDGADFLQHVVVVAGSDDLRVAP